jgi:CubicO group peptidase (beta-lactamase class C family)
MKGMLLMNRRELLSASQRAVLGYFLLPAAPGPAGTPLFARAEERAPWEALLADLEQQLPGLMAEAKTPGLSLAIIRDAKVLWRRGFGVRDSASRQPVDDDTVFEAASVSKTVFAYAVMKLCEKGVMDLDTPLTRYTPDRYLEGDPRLDLITARHVLTHTSGFQNWRSAAEPLKIHFTPGEKRFFYSGEGFSYLQSVVTRLAGRVNREQFDSY